MKKTERKRTLLTLLMIALAIAAAIFAVGVLNVSDPAADMQIATVQQETEPGQIPAIPLAARHIVLSYPAELQEDVNVRYEDLENGQRIIFTTGFTGEELELFRFFIGKSDDDGFLLGVLEDEEAGSLTVSVDVKAYADGNWKPEDFNKLNAMQERVNDILLQFYEDPRFVPST